MHKFEAPRLARLPLGQRADLMSSPSSAPSADALRLRAKRKTVQAQKRHAKQQRLDSVARAKQTAKAAAQNEPQDQTFTAGAVKVLLDDRLASGYHSGVTEAVADMQANIDAHAPYLHDLHKDKAQYDHFCDVINHNLPEEACEQACPCVHV